MKHPHFIVDTQTTNDLSIFSKASDEQSIFGLFDYTVTIGGKKKLSEIFKTPLKEKKAIQERIDALKYFDAALVQINLNKNLCDFIEHYLIQPDKPTTISKFRAIERKLFNSFKNDNNFYIVEKGVANTLELIRNLQKFTSNCDYSSMPSLLKSFYEDISTILSAEELQPIIFLLNRDKLSAIELASADYLFRYLCYDKITKLLEITYYLDVLQSVHESKKKNGFCLPILNNDQSVLKFTKLFHPLIDKPVSNDLEMELAQNVCFFTGANMAGKSTFLKAIGIAIFLSQLGFPVPASNMETGVFDGLITSINLPDDIQKQKSHFYSEVLRIKNIAELMVESPNMVVIFDELFRSTNVKDAYDASLEIIHAFLKLKQGFFIFSSHIVELAIELSKKTNVHFYFFEVKFENNTPVYSYILKKGITNARLGLWILKRERVTELIGNISRSS